MLFLKQVLPVVVGMNGKTVLNAPLFGGKAAGLLLGKTGGPFVEF